MSASKPLMHQHHGLRGYWMPILFLDICRNHIEPLLPQSLNPHLLGLLGRYCFNKERPLNAIIISSTAWNSSGDTFKKLSRSSVNQGRIFQARSFSLASCVTDKLSTKCKLGKRAQKQFLDMMELTPL